MPFTHRGFACALRGLLAGVASTLSMAADAQVVDDIRIGPVGAGWSPDTRPNGDLVFTQRLDSEGHLCVLTLGASRLLIGDPAADYARQWKTLVAPEVAVPSVNQHTLQAGWITLAGERAGKRKDGQFRLFALYTATDGLRVQSVLASANDERCAAPLTAMTKTLKVLDMPRSGGPSTPASGMPDTPR